MYKKLLAFTVLCIAFIIGTGAFFMHSRESSDDRERELQQNIITINAVQKLIENGEYESAVIKTAELEAALRNSSSEKRGNNDIFVICLVCIGAVMFVSGYVYVKILMPFDKLSGFAENIAKGDFDTPLEYQRSAYFGLFTWAFDNMRSEINKSRACEREAIENNKTVIATLSHDIKTPVASIRAYAEGIDAGMAASPEKLAKYCSVIMRKCDEVSRLTNDLFTHSIADLDKLSISSDSFELVSAAQTVVSELSGEQGDIVFEMPCFEAEVKLDKNRFEQICENLINNSRKYAKTDINVFFTRDENTVTMHFKDKGNGINDADMPFIFDKFYRGKNCGDEQGSGLGLYIVKYLVQKQGGSVLLHNMADGFDAEVTFPAKLSGGSRAVLP